MINSRHMLNRPYIKEVIRELKLMGHEDDRAKEILIKYYRPIKRSWGFGPNAYDFAKEIDFLDKAVNREFDSSDPNQIFIGHLKSRINSKN
ncbi:hypothetical protein R50345_27295 [Paenibacillus sp. FSL R5-0345]|uniref:hypothetical protein n=1 Tax=unclassified Paenibacillus TaxID=185978 RepID=UPI0004F65482|nr:hypothetical protein [Paenibacillus sp. FSL R5-0345]AIQ37992.1 hypothetical protein R50345_27295 [Paenibacillus sp. FSL R5-0345]